jgi:hypothetical protein
MNKTVVGLGSGLALIGFLLAVQRFEDLTLDYGVYNDGT